MIGIGWLAQALLGTTTQVVGLPCTPTAPPSMTVDIGEGMITGFTEIETTTYGALPVNPAALVKVGINNADTPFTLTAPTTSGDSINYLIEGEFQEVDGTPIILPYVNANNPSAPYSGPNNSGTPQNTVRTQIVGLQLKAGAQAPTGTQTTPATDAGWVPLYVITVNFGQTTIVSGDISVAPGAPFFSITTPSVPYDIPGGCAGTMIANQVLLKFKPVRLTTFPANFAGSIGDLDVATTNALSMNIIKNGSTVGTITVAAGATACVFASSSGAAVSVDPATDDTLRVVGPASPDVAAAVLGFTFKASVAS